MIRRCGPGLPISDLVAGLYTAFSIAAVCGSGAGNGAGPRAEVV